MHILALYGWTGNFDIQDRPEIPEALRTGLDANFNKFSAFTEEDGKERRRTLSRKLDLTSAIRQFPGARRLSLDEVVDGNFLNTRSHMSIDQKRKRYLVGVQQNWEQWVLPHLRMIARYVTPLYGFSATGPAPDILFYASGCATTVMTYEKKMLADSLMRHFIHKERHLEGYMHDLYKFNLISSPHIERKIENYRLIDWIKSGDRGKIFDVSDCTFAWIAPDRVAPSVRRALVEAGIIYCE
jgi:hypothetical protein